MLHRDDFKYAIVRIRFAIRTYGLEKQAGQFVLPERRERSYPRSVKPRAQKYAVQKANKNNASQA